MAGKEIAVKKYVVRLTAEERGQLDELISKGKRSAQLLTKARILLKADVSDAGEGWSDSRIAAARDTSIANIERTRRQLVEEGFEAVLTRKYNPNSARPRIFDGAAEAKLIALTLSPAPEGFARWSLRLLEEKVVELHIVERASDNTIGRTLKKTFLAELKVQRADGVIAVRDDGSLWPSEKEMQTRVSHWLRDQERASHIGAGTTLHGLRVSYAAWWKRNGASDSEVAALIGDVSDKMGKHYTRHVEAEISIIRAFDRLKDKQ